MQTQENSSKARKCRLTLGLKDTFLKLVVSFVTLPSCDGIWSGGDGHGGGDGGDGGGCVCECV